MRVSHVIYQGIEPDTSVTVFTLRSTTKINFMRGDETKKKCLTPAVYKRIKYILNKHWFPITKQQDTQLTS